MSSLSGRLKFCREYKRPSKSGDAARIAVASLVINLQTFSDETEMSEESIYESFVDANQRVGNYNSAVKIREDTVDYLMKDYACCIAAVFVDDLKNKVHYGFICDSGVAIFRPDYKNGDFVFMTPCESPHKPELEEIIKRCGGWRKPLARRTIREQFRNNPDEPLSYGVLSGEKNAMFYVRTGMQERKDGDIVLAYTDGVGDILMNEKLSGKAIELLRKRDFSALRRYCRKNVGSEGALVYSY